MNKSNFLYQHFLIIVLFIVLLSLLACNQQLATRVGPVPLPNSFIDSQNEIVMKAQEFNFLEGNWIRINDDEGLQTYENWKRKSPVEFIAKSFSVSNNQVVWEENSSLKITHNKVILKIKTSPLKSINYSCSKTNELDYIICTNYNNDYPNKIEYWMQNDTLNSKISGGGPDVSFIYIKNLN